MESELKRRLREDAERRHAIRTELAAIWSRANTTRPGYFADLRGSRLHVEQTTRSMHAPANVSPEFTASIGGIRIGEYATIAEAQRVAEGRAVAAHSQQFVNG